MSEEIDQETQEKQNYLRINIMDAGYDPNVFVEFLINKKGEAGADVANWSLPDLKNVVQEFIKLNNNNSNNNNNNNNNSNNNSNNNNNNNNQQQQQEKQKEENKSSNNEKNNENEITEIKNENEKKENINIQNKEKGEEFTYGILSKSQVQCVKVPNNQISNCNNVKITVGSFEKVEGKLFSKSYVSYLVTTSPFNWNVRRRFSDFEWLRQTLVNHYNYCLIPCVPKKPKNLNKIMSDKFDKEFLSKRSRNFEKFLNYIIIDPVLKNLQLIHDFLTMEKDDEFQKMKKSYDKLKISTLDISKVLSIDGIAKIEINEEKEKYFTDIKSSTNLNENILKKINATIKALKEDLINASEKLIEISNNFNLLKENAINYKENEEVIRTYNEMSDMFVNFSSYITNQNKIFNIDLREYFKYVKNNYRSMKEFINKINNMKNAVYKSIKNLKSKKEDLFRKQEVNKWEFNPKENIDKTTIGNNKSLALEKMLYNETLQISYKKILYGFYLNRIIAEHERMKKINSDLHYKYSINIFEMMTNKTTDFMTNLADNSSGLNTNDKINKKINEEENLKTNDNIDNNNENKEKV